MTSTSEDRQLRILKRIVKVMGVMLVVGTIIVIMAAVYKLSTKIKVSSQTKAEVVSHCEFIAEATLPIEGNVTSMKIHHNQLILSLEHKGQSRIVTVDRCNGKVLQILTF